MSVRTKPNQAQTNNVANSKHKGSITKSTQRSMRANSENKIARDLRQQFDEYVLKQQQAQQVEEEEENAEDEQIGGLDEEEQSLSDHQQEKLMHHREMEINSRRPPLRQSIGALSQHNLNMENSNSRKIKISKLVSHYQPQASVHSKTLQVPRSYLLALEHLQQALEQKDGQIQSLKEDLMEKEEIIYGCQTKINDILLRYHELTDSYELKEAEIRVLKQQMEQLKRDKEITLKQAARMLRGEFKAEAPRTAPQEQNAFTTFKNRSISSNLGSSHPQQPLISAAYGKQLATKNQIFNLKKSNLTSKQIYNATQSNLQKTHPENLHSSLTARPSIVSPSPHLCSSPPIQLSEKQRNKDFITYQRQVLRNEKQLIALKYRMECLERKLSSNPKEDNVKQKIRKLSEEIQSKERSINDLKRM